MRIFRIESGKMQERREHGGTNVFLSSVFDVESAATIHSSHVSESKKFQQLPNFVGISEATAGAKILSMNLVIIPPGGAAQPHVHCGYETAIYLLQGHVETRYGPGLSKSMIHEAGDFIFIPADVPHQPVNLSATEPATGLVARNDPNEQESVVAYDPATES